MSAVSRIRNAGTVIVAAVAVAGLAGAAASAASPAHPARQAPRAAATSTIRLSVHGGSMTFINIRHSKAIGVGDEIIMAQPAFAAAHPAVVAGHSYVTVVFLTRAAARVSADLVLKAGDIELSGINASNPFRLAVTGGTGSYAGARGQATVRTGTGKSNPATFVISLTR